MGINIERNQDAVSVSVWNRVYSADNSPVILSSILSGGKEMLAAPISIYLESDGEKCEFCDAVTRIVISENNEKNILRTFQSDSSVVNVCQTYEEDGCGNISITVMPRGRVSSYSAIKKEVVFHPNKLCMEVKIKEEFAKYFHIYPHNYLWDDDMSLQGSDELPPYKDERHNLNASTFIPNSGFHASFREQVYISGDNGGLAFMFRDDKAWKVDDKNQAFEIIKCDDGNVLVRFHLLDSTPTEWQSRFRNGIDLPPRTFNFAIAATPIKQYPVDKFYERNFHLDCFKKIPTDLNFDEFLENEFESSGENCYDRIKRLGVEVLYIHERWNDIQNYPYLTEETLKRAKKIVDECHKRGIKVIPYFGYELSTLTSTFTKRADELVRKDPHYPGWHWYRFPYQRDLIVCQASEWMDILYTGICKVYDECGFDGLYFDGTLEPHCCYNTEHGCGYVGEDGELHTTYPIWETRKFVKKIYSFIKSRGGTLNVHGNGAYNLLTVNYCDSLWEGETFQKLLLNDIIDYMPEGVLRARFTGRDIGIPVYALCYSREDVWKFKSGIAISLLHGSVPKPVDIGEPLEQMSKIWDALDAFPLDIAVWKPYWSASEKVSCDCKDVKISVWETKNEYLCVCTSCTKDFDKSVNITCDLPIIKDILGNEIISENGNFEVALKGIDCIIFTAKKQ